MQVNNIQQNAVYGVMPRSEAEDRRDGIVPEEENEVPRKRDEYVPSEEDEDIGLYSPPNDDPEEKSETTTCNTDRVDEEIKRLKEKQEQVEPVANADLRADEAVLGGVWRLLL